jgi:hypothetical protein
MKAESHSKLTGHDCLAARAPRPLPGWLQAGVVLLFLVQGLQMLTHHNGPSLSANAAPGTSPPASLAYVYEPAGVIDAGGAQAAFPYSSHYAHAASVQFTHCQAYDSTPRPRARP